MMAINPLFSGPGQHNKFSKMTYPAPSKKQKMDEGLAENDPFQDFEESFTADDLETLDFIESQALSQQVPLPSANAALRKAPPNRVNGTFLSEESFGHTSSGYESMPQNNNAPRSFSFKPLNSRSPNVPPKSNISAPQKFQTKPVNPPMQPPHKDQGRKQMKAPQTNVQRVNYDSSKIYVGLQSSPSNLKSSPPNFSSQNRYKGSQVSISKKPQVQQATSKKTHMQQSNLSVPLHSQDSPQSQGFGISNAVDHQAKASHSRSGEVRYNLSAHTLHQGGSTKSLTPPAGSTSSGSPNLPTQTEVRDTQGPKYVMQEYEKLKEELKALKTERFAKDGEIQVLRQNLSKTKTEISRLKVEKVEQEEKWRREQVEKEKELSKEAESLKTQLQFKERELTEAQSTYRNLEQRLQTPCSSSSSMGPAAKNPITPPRNSPRFSSSTLLPRRANGEYPSPKHQQQQEGGGPGGFPTRESFMEVNPAVGGSPARVKMRLVEEGKAMSRSPKRSASRSPARSPKVSFKAQMKTERVRAASRRGTVASSRMMLSCRYPRDHLSSGQLMGRLMGQPHPQSYQADTSAQGPLISTLQIANIHLDSRSSLRDEVESKATTSTNRQEKAAVSISPTMSKNYKCAMRAISSSCYNSIEKLPLTKMEGASMTLKPSNHPDHSTEILGVLPLIEEQLTAYIDAVHMLSVCSSSLASTCPSSSMGRSLDSSLNTIAREEQLQFERTEAAGAYALQTLSCLVCYSPAVCTHIIHGSEAESGEEDRSLMEIDPSAPLIDPTQLRRSISQTPSTSHQTSPTGASETQPDLPRCQIMSRLVKLISTLSPEGKGQGGEMLDTALRILLQLAQSTQPDILPRFSELLSSDVLHHHLNLDCSHGNTCLALSILTSLSKSWHLTQKFCSQSDTCLLQHVYQCASQGGGERSSEETLVASKIIDLLTNITSLHEDGPNFLLETDCQCSEEVVSSLVVMLSREFRHLQQPELDINKQRLEVVSRGLLPLHSLSLDSHLTDPRLDGHQQYSHLIAEMNRLVARLPNIHRHEVGFLQDFEGSDEDDWEQDSQEAATQMDVS